MVPAIRALFDALLASHVPRDAVADVLEIGATPTSDTLLTLPYISHARRIGANPEHNQAVDGAWVYNWSGRDIPAADSTYDVVLCNSVLEHDLRFWETVSEMRRVLRPEGWLLVGVPSFTQRIVVKRPSNEASTVTMAIHACPEDYYRFSPAVFTELIFAGFEQVKVSDVMDPPRLVGIGRKPAIGNQGAD